MGAHAVDCGGCRGGEGGRGNGIPDAAAIYVGAGKSG